MLTKKVWKINKIVLPQHADHAGVMWHGTYFNWLEESRLKAISDVGLNYCEITKKGFDLPLVSSSIKYMSPLYLGEEITIESEFHISKSPRIKVSSKFLNTDKKVLTIAEVDLVLIKNINFSIVKKRPNFISNAFFKLQG